LKGIIKDNYDDSGKLIRTMHKDIKTLLAALVTKYVDHPAIPDPDRLIIKKKIAGRKYEDAWYYLNPDYLNPTNPANKKRIKQFQHLVIKDYLDGMESVMKKNSKELGKAISAHLLKRVTTADWDELVVNKFKIKKVHIAKWSVLDYFGGEENEEYGAFIDLVKKYGMRVHDTADTISTYMNSVSQDLIEDNSVAKITGGKKRKWAEVPLNVLGKDNDVTQNIYDLITKTYAPIGGYVDFSKPGDLPSDFTDWIINDIDKDPEVDAVRFAKKGPGGTKFAGSATDGSAAAKKIMLNKTAKMLNQKGNYGEVSDAIAHVLLTRYDIPVVTDEEQVKKLLPGKKIKWIGENPNGKYPGVDGWYERVLTGAGKHLKIMVGKPKKI
jgi:hypothetical protein